jgi:hypothetical protein
VCSLAIPFIKKAVPVELFTVDLEQSSMLETSLPIKISDFETGKLTGYWYNGFERAGSLRIHNERSWDGGFFVFCLLFPSILTELTSYGCLW